MAKKLNYRQRKTIEEYLKNPQSKVKAVQRVTPDLTYKSARVTAHRIITDTNIIQYLQEMGIREGEDLRETLRKNLIQFLNANLIVEYKGKATEQNLPDYTTRIKGFDRLIRLLGLDIERKQTETRGFQITEEMRNMSIEEIHQRLKELYQKMAEEEEATNEEKMVVGEILKNIDKEDALDEKDVNYHEKNFELYKRGEELSKLLNDLRNKRLGDS